MTFDDTWRLAGPRTEQMRQLGNAVPVELGLVVARAITALLSTRRTLCHDPTAPAARGARSRCDEPDDESGTAS
jgi:hypothetical protein